MAGGGTGCSPNTNDVILFKRDRSKDHHILGRLICIDVIFDTRPSDTARTKCGGTNILLGEVIAMTCRLLLITVLFAAMVAGDPLTITFSGTGSGFVGVEPFESAAFTFTFVSDTSLVVVPACCVTDYSTPSGTPATFSILGIGSGTLTDNQAVFANPNPANLTVGMWHFNLPDVLDLSSGSFANYNLSTNKGPVLIASPFAFSNGFSSSLGTIALASASNVTYTAVVEAEVPEPSTLGLLSVGLALCFAWRYSRPGRPANRSDPGTGPSHSPDPENESQGTLNRFADLLVPVRDRHPA
jgi:hypothetical protein